jgi:hypothetical protein
VLQNPKIESITDSSNHSGKSEGPIYEMATEGITLIQFSSAIQKLLIKWKRPPEDDSSSIGGEIPRLLLNPEARYRD